MKEKDVPRYSVYKTPTDNLFIKTSDTHSIAIGARGDHKPSKLDLRNSQYVENTNGVVTCEIVGKLVFYDEKVTAPPTNIVRYPSDLYIVSVPTNSNINFNKLSDKLAKDVFANEATLFLFLSDNLMLEDFHCSSIDNFLSNLVSDHVDGYFFFKAYVVSEGMPIDSKSTISREKIIDYVKSNYVTSDGGYYLRLSNVAELLNMTTPYKFKHEDFLIQYL